MLTDKENGPVLAATSEPGHGKHCRLNPTTKRAAILREFVRLGERGLNCFEAANCHHDYVLRSTVSDLQRQYGVTFARKTEDVPNAFGTATACKRYWLTRDGRIRAVELLDGRPMDPRCRSQAGPMTDGAYRPPAQYGSGQEARET